MAEAGEVTVEVILKDKHGNVLGGAVTEKPWLEREDLANLLHTALRKRCDSPPATLAWNLIHVLPRSVWKAYLDLAHRALLASTCRKDAEDLGQALRSISFGPNASWLYQAWHTSEEQHLARCLALAFTMFGRDDWTGFAAFVGEL